MHLCASVETKSQSQSHLVTFSRTSSSCLPLGDTEEDESYNYGEDVVAQTEAHGLPSATPRFTHTGIGVVAATLLIKKDSPHPRPSVSRKSLGCVNEFGLDVSKIYIAARRGGTGVNSATHLPLLRKRTTPRRDTRREIDTAPPDQGPWPTLFQAAFYAHVWCTYRAGFEHIRDLPSLASLPLPLVFAGSPASFSARVDELGVDGGYAGADVAEGRGRGRAGGHSGNGWRTRRRECGAFSCRLEHGVREQL
ncbi:hypothetical protein C8R45DRAFT_1096677 [Mycena sanguinolenta]|nr:hypothetical protein C8R45DRAFT_1096677 [Mycena sanguinolenta]